MLTLAIVALVSALARGVWSNGVFSSVNQHFSGSCKVAAHLPGVADIEVANGIAFITVSSARGPTAADGIYALTLKGAPVRLPGAPKDFHPRGLSLYRTPDGKGLFLMAVNRHSADRFSIDSFEVTNPFASPALVVQSSIEGGLLTNPQDVAMASPVTFYVANGTARKNPLLHALQTTGILPSGNILYFNGLSFAPVVDGLYGVRSLLLTQGGSHLVAASLFSRSLTSFSREPFTGALTQSDNRLLPAGPDKLSVDGQGAILAGAHANLLDWRAFAADPTKRAASQILHIAVAGGAAQVYGNDGGQIAGASAAAVLGNRLLIGSSLDDRLLDCTLP